MKSNDGEIEWPQALIGSAYLLFAFVGLVGAAVSNEHRSWEAVAGAAMIASFGLPWWWAAMPTHYEPGRTRKVGYDARGALIVRTSRRARIARAARESLFGLDDVSGWDVLGRYLLWPVFVLVFEVRVLFSFGRATTYTFHDDQVVTRYPHGRETVWCVSVPLGTIRYGHSSCWIDNREGETLYLKDLLRQDAAALLLAITQRGEASTLNSIGTPSTDDGSGTSPFFSSVARSASPESANSLRSR